MHRRWHAPMLEKAPHAGALSCTVALDGLPVFAHLTAIVEGEFETSILVLVRVCLANVLHRRNPTRKVLLGDEVVPREHPFKLVIQLIVCG